MTEQTQPTDADLKERCAEIVEWQRTGVLHGSALRNYAGKHWAGHTDALQMAERDTSARAMELIAKWGTHAGAGEPAGRVVSANCQYATVEWLQQTSEVGGGDPDNSRSWPITGDAVYLTPQPTQAQAGAAPLKQYRVLEPGVDRIEADDEYLQDDAQTWAIDPNGTFVGTLYGYALRSARRRIKGADHA